MERWVGMQGHSEHQVSDHGRIRGPKGLLKLTLTVDGYYQIGIRKSGKTISYRVNRLVALHFCEGYEDGLVAAHNDGNRANNRWDNLRWATQKSNVADMKLHGTAHRGEAHRNSKVTEAQVREIREKSACGQSALSLAVYYGLSDTAVRGIVKRESWKDI